MEQRGQWQFICDLNLGSDEVGNRLTSRADQGWELVTVTQVASVWSLFFKKVK